MSWGYSFWPSEVKRLFMEHLCMPSFRVSVLNQS